MGELLYCPNRDACGMVEIDEECEGTAIPCPGHSVAECASRWSAPKVRPGKCGWCDNRGCLACAKASP